MRGRNPFGVGEIGDRSRDTKGPVKRHEIRNLKAFNFVIENALGGGVTISLAQDIHGKSLCNVMLAIELPDYAGRK